MSNLDNLLEECRRQDEEMQEITAKIGNICDKIREDLSKCERPEDCKDDENSVELPELKKASL